MDLSLVLDQLQKSSEGRDCIVHWETLPPKKAVYADFPESLNFKLKIALERKGINKLYSHQASAIENILSGNNVVIVTPTASGKTLCYNLPILNKILENPEGKALYLFPTKALSQDQVAELQELINLVKEDIKTYTFDGDTPVSARKAIRTVGQIVVTNPDMLHSGILPNHTKWNRIFENLKYVVIDEVHHYRGVFGSHLANVVRRLKRICKFYGSQPQFIFCSATIANPQELAEKISEENVVLINNNGAPSGEKHFLLYNPPLINKQLGIRKSSTNEVQRLAGQFLENNIATIAFAPSRLRVEVLLTYLKEKMAKSRKSADSVRGYRGGYLPMERRKIEQGLRAGTIKGVVSTNALELGIDIGQLEVCLMTGYPGNIASTWQQAGRAGRRQDVSLAILVANSSPLDQYLMQHPEYFFSQTPEHGIIDPNNLVILMSHIKCAAFELPFEKGDKFGVDTTQDILNYLEQQKVLHFVDDKWHWNSEIYPAEQVSLRSASPENFVILNSSDNNRVIGEVDYFSAPIFLFPDAIYLHGGRQYQIEKLDWDGKKAYAKEVEVDYYTDPETKTEIKVLQVNQQQSLERGEICLGEVSVSSVAVLYKKIKFHTHENIGAGRIYLPEQEMHTEAFWYEFPSDIGRQLELSKGELGGGLSGLAYILGNIACLWVMCDPRDIRTFYQQKAPVTEKPTLYLYDNYPGGVGFAEKIFKLQNIIWLEAKKLIEKCLCEVGCPSCVGPILEPEGRSKLAALKLLDFLTGQKT